jgi:hypothetical protein
MRRTIIAIALLLSWGGAYATDMVMRQGENYVRLSDSPCVHGGTLAILSAEWRDKFKKAVASINGKAWFACWILEDDGQVYVLYEDGDENRFPVAAFKPDGGI